MSRPRASLNTVVRMGRHGFVAICAASVIAMGLATMLHEAAHVVAGGLAGGSPTLITGTEVKGDFHSLSPRGFVLLGISGSLVNALFCGLGWWLLGRESRSVERQLFAWFLFAINGMLVVMKMAAEPLMGFGDWMTILEHLPATAALRVVVAILGVVGMVLMVRRSGAALGRIATDGDATARRAEARRIVAIGALAAGILVLGGAVTAPVGSTRSVLLALGAGLGPFLPLLAGTRFVPKTPSLRTSPLPAGGWPWPFMAGLVVGILWLVVGPGIALGS